MKSSASSVRRLEEDIAAETLGARLAASQRGQGRPVRSEVDNPLTGGNGTDGGLRPEAEYADASLHGGGNGVDGVDLLIVVGRDGIRFRVGRSGGLHGGGSGNGHHGHRPSRPTCGHRSLRRRTPADQIARAPAQTPRVLLLDEPTAFLDLQHQIEICSVLRRLRDERGLTVVIVSHDLNLASQYCDRVVMLKEAGLFGGSPSEVMSVETLREVYGCEVFIDPHPSRGFRGSAAEAIAPFHMRSESSVAGGVRARSTRIKKRARNHRSTECQEDAVSVGEDGAKPSRCRHCKRGVTLPLRHCVPSTWEGAGKRRSASQETQLTDISIQPFESKGGFVCGPAVGRDVSCSRCVCP